MFGDMTAGMLYSSLFIGTVGFAMLIFGKKSERPWWLVCGLVLCVFPYLVHSVVLMWLGTLGLCAGAYSAERMG